MVLEEIALGCTFKVDCFCVGACFLFVRKEQKSEKKQEGAETYE
jgi:hypothetical protein